MEKYDDLTNARLMMDAYELLEEVLARAFDLFASTKAGQAKAKQLLRG